jgi:large subunit ribosomal protein L24e
MLRACRCRARSLTLFFLRLQGIKLARTDGQVLLFLNSKCKRLYNNKLKASKLAWTALYRKAHKKDQSTEATRRKKRSTKVTISRSIGSASLELIQKRRNEKSDVRAAARENALREIKERAKKLKEEKAKLKQTSAAAKPKQAAPKTGGGMPKGGKPVGKR